MPAGDPVAAEAVRGFAAAHPALRLAPVAAVIPALDEELTRVREHLQASVRRL